MLRRLALCVALLGTPAAADDLQVFAAASLRDALGEVAQDYSTRTGTEVVLSFAGSGALARQIQHGAPADVFVSANVGWMDTLAEAGAIEAQSRVTLLSNRLVLIAPAPHEALTLDGALIDTLGEGRLAMGLVDAVPAGIYGKAALIALGLWEAVESRVAQTDNVRAALALVATSEAPLGVVYETDALAEPRVAVVATFPDDSHPPITYPAAITAQSDHPEAAAFLGFLRGDAARARFGAHGFTFPPAAADGQ